MKRKNWKQILLSWLLVFAMSSGMTASATAAGMTEQDTGDNVWTKDTPVSPESLAAAENVPEQAEPFAEDENVRVLIALDGTSVVEEGYSTDDIARNRSAMRYADKLESRQKKITDAISEEALDGEALKVRYHFTLLSNAVSAEVAYGEVAKIREVDGVAGVYVVPQYDVAAADAADPNTVTAGQMVGSYNTWESGYTGAGQRIAVIDTGLDTDHPSFDSGAFAHSLSEAAAKQGVSIEDYHLLGKEEISNVAGHLNAGAMAQGVTADQLYRSDKVAYAFNYVDRDLDVTHDNDSQGDHGTHVSGISTANLYVPEGNGYARQKNGVVGIAPDAQLMVMKVFGKAGGAYPDDYMAAIEDAILLDADTVNLSLGSANAGESKEYASAEQYINEIFDRLDETDTVVSISAGNAGAWADNSVYGKNLKSDVSMDTVGSPGSYTNAFTVASADNVGYTGYCVQVGDASVYYADASNDDVAMPPFRSLDTAGTGTSYDYILLAGVGKPEDYQGIEVRDKIVLVSRGEISFADKHQNASQAGAAGILIYNNAPGTISMSVTGSVYDTPCASITQADAEIIRNKSEKISEKVYQGTMVVNAEISTNYNATNGHTMSDFSSWGVPGSLSLKPEITAPGGNIYSTINNGEYGLMSGTSMASPSVAGMSALAAEYIKKNNLDQKTGLSVRTLAQSLLMSTAAPLEAMEGSDGAKGLEYSPRKQGAGLANIEDATKSPVYILMDQNGADGKVKAELGDDPGKTGSYSFGFTLHNMSGNTQYYTTDSSILTEEIQEDAYIAGVPHKLSPNVKITSSSMEKRYDLNLDGTVDKADAQVLLQVVNKSAVSDKVSLYEDCFDFNKDGAVNTADVYDFLGEINGVTSQANLEEDVIAVKDSAKISVQVTLSDEDKAYLAAFENGMYVDGFIYLNGAVNLSVPMLAFYGSWADSSMFEPFDYLSYINGGQNDGQATYSGEPYANYLSYQFAGSSAVRVYNSNMYVEDDAYIPDRNAFSSQNGDRISAIHYSLIRNASKVTAAITDANDPEKVYLEKEIGAGSAEYYSDTSAAWKDTSASVELNWDGKDKDGNKLADGIRVNITVTALPSYYDHWTETGLPGKGVTFTVPMVIDNTMPEVLGVADSQTAANKLEVTVRDNRYVAAVAVLKRDKSTVLASYAVNQQTANTQSSIQIEIPAADKVFYVAAVDYAGNMTMYRVNESGQPDTWYPTEVTLDKTSLNLRKGATDKLTATVGPETIMNDTVIWSSTDETVASVDQNGVVTAKAVGQANITATTRALNVSGEPEEATCSVTVEELDVTLNSIYWDESSNAYWSSFHSNDTENLQKLSEAQDAQFMSAAAVGDKLLAATYGDGNSQMSQLYLVDPANGYTAQRLGEELPWCTDLAYSNTTGMAVGTYGTYLMFIDLRDGSYQAVDASSVLKGEYFAGITYGGYNRGNGLDLYYAVDRKGTLYLMGMAADGNIQMALISELGVNTGGSWYYDSLHFDFDSGYLFWSVFDSDSGRQTLYGIKENGFNCSKLGSFPAGIWPVCGLYSASDLITASQSAVSNAAGLEKGAILEKVSGELPKLEMGTVK